MINSDQMWEILKKYLESDKALELGFSNGKYTRILAKFAKDVTAVDISEDFFRIATENLKGFNNIKLMLMDALNLEFDDKSFDVILNTSFHEFDLSGEVFSLDLDLKRKILKEMIRVSDLIVFAESSDDSITNELFSVFNPNEKHSYRISESNKLIDIVMEEEGYELVEKGYSFNETKFDSRKELEEEVITWWDDIKIPSTEEEKQEMTKQITKILDTADMLDNLTVIEKTQFRVFKRK